MNDAEETPKEDPIIAKAKEMLNKKAEELGVMFNAVEIIGVVEIGGQRSRMIFGGHGCIYTRLGAIKDWVLMEDERTRQSANPEDEE